tara:strand:- start:1288 stop:1626 length:339 start_codon:yes stop_codon:yes gene_type:complete
MNIEPLKSILEISNDKKETLMYFLPVDTKRKIVKCDLEEKDFYINDRVFCIKRNTLELEIVGKIICIDDKNLGIKKQNMNVYIDSNKYYIFVKYTKQISSQREFLKKLLETL